MVDILTRMRLHLTPGVGFKTYSRLLAHFPESEIFSRSFQELQQVEGIGPVKAKALQDPHYLELAYKEVEQARQENVTLLPLEELPPLLAQINDPPLLLFLKGRIPQDRPMITIVGTRRCSYHGKQETLKLAQQLCQKDFWIVSGLAQGIDTAAHQGALAKGQTIAVLGSGLNQIYPQQNRVLAEKILAQGGVLLSEFPLDAPPQKENFPRRNRILAGLAPVTLLMEAPVRSGAIITVEQALEYGREVFVTPGPIYKEFCRGSNLLLREGANICLEVEDLLQAYSLYLNPPKESKIPTKLPKEEEQVCRVLQQGELSLESLIELLPEFSFVEMIQILGKLEIQGLVQNHSGKYHLSLF